MAPGRLNHREKRGKTMREALRRLWQDIVGVNRWLNALPRRGMESLLNRVFAITKPAGLQRVYARDIAFFLVIAWILGSHWSIVSHTNFVVIWRAVQGSILAKILGEIIFGLPLYLGRLAVVFAMPDSLMVLLPAVLPYLLGWYVASRYVEDVFEISDALKNRAEGLRVAQEFLLRGAFAHSYGRVKKRKTLGCRLLGPLRPAICPTEEECLSWGRSRQYGRKKVPFLRRLWDFVRGAPVGCPHTLAIVNGEVKDRRSPLLLIGGPGYVFVSTDSAALFERPDGTPHVVAPTTRRLELLEGFERLRRIVSLREHQMTLSATARSRDGIPIQVNDVQLLFSIYRGGRKPSAKEPFPFYPPALEQLVYGELASPVVDRWEALSSSRLLTNAMRVMARSELTRFIRAQTVVEFLASVAPMDIETLREVYEELARDIAEPNKEIEPIPPSLPNPPEFIPRPRIAERFNLLANGPEGTRARQRGVGLQWIGLGAWHTPVAKVLDQHLEAWRLSVTNVVRSSDVALAQLKRQRHLSAFAEYVRELLAWFQRTEDQPPEAREIALLRYFIRRMEVAALLRYGGIPHAPAGWRRALQRLYHLSLAPRDVELADNAPDEGERGTPPMALPAEPTE